MRGPEYGSGDAPPGRASFRSTSHTFTAAMPTATAASPTRLSTAQKDAVLADVISQLRQRREEIIAANRLDLDAYPEPSDRAMYDRLIVDDAKVDGMIRAVEEVAAQADPVGRVISEIERPNGLRVVNRTEPFGTVLIIYESRPDVTVEAAVIAFKAGSRILLKGGKEAVHSNRVLVDCWQVALRQNGLDAERVRLLELDRAATQAFLREPTEPLDLIVPRGGEGLIGFVKAHATCAVLVSGRGNNFLYVDAAADVALALAITLNAKTSKISACNALDKILVDHWLPRFGESLTALVTALQEAGVAVEGDAEVLATAAQHGVDVPATTEGAWDEEFLSMRCVVGVVHGVEEAIAKVNAHSGGHSASIVTADPEAAEAFLTGVDAAAVYHNASTRFTDGGEMGVGAELAISTDKLHHRGPLGTAELVTNKYYVYGAGQVR